jgi:hypothetical protein
MNWRRVTFALMMEGIRSEALRVTLPLIIKEKK